MNTKPLKPVGGRKTVQDQVYDQLREALVSGAFQARDSFTISSLAERFQTSHMPVREALRRLAAENALRISPAGTAFVPDLSRDELEDITRARIIIEGAATELAAARLGPADVAVLRAMVAEHQATGMTGDIAAMTAANRRFHFHVYAAAHSPILLSHIENLWLRSGPYVRFLSDRMGSLLQTDYRQGYTHHHQVLLDAVERGDVPGTRDAMIQDITATRDLLLRFLDEPVA